MTSNKYGEYFIPGRFSKRTEDEHMERYRFATRFVQDKHVLDIACGAGYGTYMLSEAKAAHVDGVDINPIAAEFAQQNYGSEKTRFIVGSATEFGVANSYDVVTSFETIEHVDDYEAVLRNLYRVLKPGGLLVISTPNRPMSWRPVKTLNDKPRNPYHVREFSLNEFIEIIRRHGFILESQNILGQRQFYYIANRYLRKLYMMLFHPEDRSSPMVESLKRGLQPKYIVLVGYKPPTE